MPQVLVARIDVVRMLGDAHRNAQRLIDTTNVRERTMAVGQLNLLNELMTKLATLPSQEIPEEPIPLEIVINGVQYFPNAVG